MATLGLLSEDGLGYRSSWFPSLLPLPGQRQPLVPDAPPARRSSSKPRSRGAQKPASPASEDAEVVSRVKQGDERAARALFLRLHPTVISIVRGHLPKRTQEEDLTQAVFAKVFSKLDQFSGLVPLEHWVSRIAVNTCINQLKHEKVRPELRMSDLSEEQESVVQQLATSDDAHPDDNAAHACEMVQELLSHLRPEDQRVLRLLHLEERSVAEISRRTGWSVSCVKVRAFRARARMRTLWDTLYRDNAW